MSGRTSRRRPTIRCCGSTTSLVSPHTAGITRQSRHNIAKIAAEQMLDILDGKKPPRLLNPEVWPVYRDRFARILGFRPE